jgi:diguanylate cyclase
VTAPIPQGVAEAAAHRPHLGFAKRNRVARSVGLLFAALAIGTVLWIQQAPPWMWLGPVFHCLVWPQLAWCLALASADPREAERRNLLIDHLMGGAWTALMSFSVVPCASALGLMSMNTMAGGGTRLLWRGLLAHALGVGAGVLVFGWRWQPESGLAIALACVPALFVQPLAIGHTASLALRKLHRKNEELERHSRQDGLSGLFNRSHWETLVAAELAHCRQTGRTATLVLTDLDHFKRINDDFGHAAGDTAIRRFGDLLRQGLREGDTPGRYGGEEFGILLPGTRIEEAREVIERLRERMRAAPLIPGATVTASFGAAELGPDIAHADAWMRRADQMLYRAKHLGRNRLVAAGDAPAADSPPMEDLRPALSAGGFGPALAQMLGGLEASGQVLALFDPADRLSLATPAFMSLYAVGAGQATFDDIIRHCHQSRQGPRIDTDDLDDWLRQAGHKRRSLPSRSFLVDMLDGRWFHATETAYGEGWLLLGLGEVPAPPGAGRLAAPVGQALLH